ncbi:MAG: iron ABC transporter permease [Actinomycetota bacterium]|nr:MAG: iron ABC transporter permease [Actinomycetota bacterium]
MDGHRAAVTDRYPTRLLVAFAAAPVVFVGLLFVWPLAAILARGFDLGVLADLVRNPGIRSVAWFTLWQAIVSTLATLVVGMLPAFLIARYRFAGRGVLLAIVTVPFVLPTVVVGAAFLALSPERFDRTVWSILAAHVFFNIAVVVRTVGTLWEQLDPDLAAAARTLGASNWQVVRHVTLPLLRPSIVAAASIVFLFTFTSFGVIRILGGPARATIEVEIYLRAAQLGDLPGAAGLAVVQLVAVGSLLWWWSRDQARTAVPLALQAGSPRRRPRPGRERRLVIGGALLTGVTMLVPVVALVLRSFRVGDQWSLSAWRLGSAESQGASAAAQTWDAVATSLRYACAAAIVALVLGALAAFAIAGSGRAGRALDVGLMLPLGTSAVTIGFGILITFDEPPLDLRDSAWLVPLVHALVAVPFVVRAVLPVLRALPADLRHAASTLGAAPLRVWREIELPLAARGLAAGAAFAFAVSLGEFGATSFLTRRNRETLPIAIGRHLGRPGELVQAEGYVLAVILLGLTVAAVAALGMIGARDVIGEADARALRQGSRQ